jgi:hypothetical protein
MLEDRTTIICEMCGAEVFLDNIRQIDTISEEDGIQTIEVCKKCASMTKYDPDDYRHGRIILDPPCCENDK